MDFKSSATAQGTPVHVLHVPQAKSVALCVLVNAGTRDERDSEAGIAHATEHMVFRGNERLANSASITAEIEDHGGHINACTSSEWTSYFCVVPHSVRQVGVRCLASLVWSPCFSADHIPSEMENIVQEIHELDGNPADACPRYFRRTIYGSHPRARNILGTIETVRAFTTADFNSWWKRMYHPHNCKILAVGAVTTNEIADLFSQVGPRAAGSPDINARKSEKPLSANGWYLFPRDIEQAHVSLGALVGSSQESETKALNLFAFMLSGGMSFPLFVEMRDMRGLCYTTDACVDTGMDCGTFSVYIGTDPNRVHEAIDCVHKLIRKSAGDQRLFERARTALMGKLQIGFDDPESMLSLANSTIAEERRAMSPSEYLEVLRAITFDEVIAAVQKYLLRPQHFTYVCVGPQSTKFSQT